MCSVLGQVYQGTSGRVEFTLRTLSTFWSIVKLLERAGGPPVWGLPRSFLFYSSDQVLSTGKFWDSIFLLHLDSDHFSSPWSSPSTTTWALVTAADSPSNPPPSPCAPLSSQSQPRCPLCLELHMAPRSLGGKNQNLHHL